MPNDKLNKGDGRMQVGMLAGLTFIVGLYLLLSMPVIERDGVVFIEYAKGLGFDARATVMGQYQHPGYPAIIWLAHKVAIAVGFGESLMLWVYSAQAATLLFRTAAVFPLYLLGRRLVGRKAAFIGGLLIAVLPGMAEYGSDVLSDWPALFFLACGLLMLLKGSSQWQWRLFGLGGIFSGLGYLVRPECAVVVIVGCLWAAWQALVAREWPGRRVALATVVLLIGFAVPAAPYMAAKGAIFPKKHIGEFAVLPNRALPVSPCPVVSASIGLDQAAGLLRAGAKLFSRTGEVLSWYFLPLMLVGALLWFRDARVAPPVRFITGCLLMVCTAVVTWLFMRHGYMSRRHVLGMMVVAVFFVPRGIEALAGWLAGPRQEGVRRAWMAGLLLAGVAICLVRLWGLSDTGRTGYIAAAKWLRANTPKDCLVAASDARIPFYAERKWLWMNDDVVPPGADYHAVIGRDEKWPLPQRAMETAVFSYRGRNPAEMSIIVYMHQR